ncbi:hypothetical protein ACF06W_32840 [Streptomyces albus]|uniref:hypothetical protein n=1 Tax=Streptomyces albus TaxID=1888 RepID=UPI0036FE78FA
MIRDSAPSDGFCAFSRHLLWTDADRPPDGPHVDYLAGMRNAVVVRIGWDTDVNTAPRHLDQLDRARAPDVRGRRRRRPGA